MENGSPCGIPSHRSHIRGIWVHGNCLRIADEQIRGLFLLAHAHGNDNLQRVGIVAVRLLLSPFNLVQSFVIALFICARHLFYGISMLDRFKGMEWKKFPLIYGMCDETFSVNYTARGPKVWTTGGLCFG